jgi:C4-type Zn-finger protein
MRKAFTCKNPACAKQFFVETDKDETPYHGEGHVDVQCPHCGWSNGIEWPHGRPFRVTK